MSSEMKELAPGDEEREYMEKRLAEIRAKHRNMIFCLFREMKSPWAAVLPQAEGFSISILTAVQSRVRFRLIRT